MPGPNATQINSQIPPLFDAKQIAAETVRSVQAIVSLGASNKPQSTAAATVCVVRLRTRIEPKIRIPSAFFRTLTDIQTIADSAIRARCGNCLEQSAVAFTLLMKRGVEPIDFMYCDGPDDDHAFVVIGRREDSYPQRYDAPTWGPSAMVCDPWMGMSYPCGEMRTNLASRTSTFIYRSAFRYRTVDGFAPY